MIGRGVERHAHTVWRACAHGVETRAHTVWRACAQGVEGSAHMVGRGMRTRCGEACAAVFFRVDPSCAEDVAEIAAPTTIHAVYAECQIIRVYSAFSRFLRGGGAGLGGSDELLSLGIGAP